MHRLFLVLSGIILILAAGACSVFTVEPTSHPPTTTPDIEPTESATATDEVAATPSRIPTEIPVCPDAPQTRLILQERGRVIPSLDESDSLNLRAGPGTNYRILENIEPGEIFMVQDGPECAEEYAWYRVRYRDVTGWVAEGDSAEYYIEPYPPG